MPAGRSASSAPTAAASPACSACSPASCTPNPATSNAGRWVLPASPRKPRPCRRGPRIRARRRRRTAPRRARAGRRRSRPRRRGDRPPARPPAEIGGYSAKARVAEVLHGLGFTDADFSRPVADFSGGWRVRLNLARALMCRSDLLLLDEPTNHLDLDAVLWLEQWLRLPRHAAADLARPRLSRRGGRPDRWHIETSAHADSPAATPTSNAQRAARLAQQQAMLRGAAARDRPPAPASSTASRPRRPRPARRKAASRCSSGWKPSPRPTSIRPSFQLPRTGAAARSAAELENAAVGYADKPILAGITLTLRPASALACSAATAPASRR
jgi:ATPase subunit of ABC transporter with duplicated ATPase domains